MPISVASSIPCLCSIQGSIPIPDPDFSFFCH
uniref:Uncharacterized protein n=1 Tax=Arundo donax TaxID=35708 RepID=A0A0A9GDI4_ARUDO